MLVVAVSQNKVGLAQTLIEGYRDNLTPTQTGGHVNARNLTGTLSLCNRFGNNAFFGSASRVGDPSGRR